MHFHSFSEYYLMNEYELCDYDYEYSLSEFEYCPYFHTLKNKTETQF